MNPHHRPLSPLPFRGLPHYHTDQYCVELELEMSYDHQNEDESTEFQQSTITYSIPFRTIAPSWHTIRTVYTNGTFEALLRASYLSSNSVSVRIRHTSHMDERCSKDSRSTRLSNERDAISFFHSHSLPKEPSPSLRWHKA